jgi:hypothetical protein
MKKIVLFLMNTMLASAVFAQTYPDPEFVNEIYFLKKDATYTLVRLEKNSADMLQQNKMAGFGGSETGYSLEGVKSPVRFQSGNLYFVFAASSSINSSGKNASSDSLMKAQGVDPNMVSGIMGGMTDPATSISLYKLETSKNGRKLITMKTPSALPFGSHKISSSEKYTCSFKKIREGYWMFQVDKVLPPGEYAFAITGMLGGMDVTMGQKMSVFAFGVD